MMFLSRSLLAVLLGSSAGLGAGCVAEIADPELDPESDPESESIAEQASTPLVFVLRSVSVPGQVVDPLFAQSGALVPLGPANITSQQRWQFVDTQLRYDRVPNLCLQPESATVGARLILRPCAQPLTRESMQQWNGHLQGGGRVSWFNTTAELWMDASAGAFGVLRLRPGSSGTQQDFIMSSQ